MCLLQAAERYETITGVRPSLQVLLLCLTPFLIAAQSPLVMTKPGQDLSAYRYDCEVFGWNKDYTEVAAVGSEVSRGPEGKQRGDVFLLVYNIGEAVPINNVILHRVTHADLPKDPVPMDDVRNFMWTLEKQFTERWPRRPKHKRGRGDMGVDLIWDFMDSDASGKCTPGVAFMLENHGKRRIQPYQALDMEANCQLLKQTDVRFYWAKKDLAVAMVRFEFSPRPDNEESARFVLSASWEQAQTIRIRVALAGPMAVDVRTQVNEVLQAYGAVSIDTIPEETKHGVQLNRIQVKRQWLPLGRRLAKELSSPWAAVVADDSTGFDVLLHYGAAPEAPPPSERAEVTGDPNAQTKVGGKKTQKAKWREGDPIEQEDAPPAVEDPTIKQQAPKKSQSTDNPTYTKDWNVQ